MSKLFDVALYAISAALMVVWVVSLVSGLAFMVRNVYFKRGGGRS